MDLSVIIPARQEMFAAQTVKNVLENIRGDSEVILVLDGAWADPVVHDHPRLKVIHHSTAIGQRAATNEGARVSQARFVMKLDSHCAVSPGFDVQLIKDHEPGMTQIPMMYSLHAFDWECQKCGHRTYQGFRPDKCEKCGQKELEVLVVWKPKRKNKTLLWRFNKDLQFQYWRGKSGQERIAKSGPMIETMSFIGACMFLERDRFWELGGMDEGHGSWGQFGTEWACKTWLSGGRLVTNTRCWFAHMFRTGNFAAPGHSTWPYPITQGEIDRARAYSRDFWRSNAWPKAVRTLDWLVEYFRPVPDWHTEHDPVDEPKNLDGPPQ